TSSRRPRPRWPVLTRRRMAGFEVSTEGDAARSSAGGAPQGLRRRPALALVPAGRAPPSAARSTRDRPDARRRSARRASLAGRRRVRRAALHRLAQDVQVEDELAHLLLELLDLLVPEHLLVLRSGPQRVLGRGQQALLPIFDLGDGQPLLARGLRHRGLTPDNAQHQANPALRSPPLYPREHPPSRSTPPRPPGHGRLGGVN